MAALRDLRQAIAASLDDLGIQVAPYSLTNPTPPTAYVELAGPISYDETMQRGVDKWTFRVTVIVSLNFDVGAQEQLDRFLDSDGTLSLKRMIEADKTLGGTAMDTHVTSTSGPRRYMVDAVSGGQQLPALGAEWTVEVRAGNL